MSLISDMITFNVGGKVFVTTKSTIARSCFLSALVSGKYAESMSTPGFIDRSPKGFVHILDFLRDVNYKVVERYQYELDYYGIDYKEENIYRVNRCVDCNKCSEHDNRCVDCSKCVKHKPAETGCHRKRRYSSSSSCWTKDAFVKTLSRYKSAPSFAPGDMVETEFGLTKINKIIKQEVFGAKVVSVNNIILTKGHPVLHEGEWIRPYERFQVFKIENTILYNFYLENNHSVYLKTGEHTEDLLVATMGRFDRN